MDESLTERRRVGDEGFRIVKPCQGERTPLSLIAAAADGTPKEAPANYVPAAAVIRRVQALSGFTGRKELVGCLVSRMLNTQA